jgi:hypothetical protein
MIHSPLPSMSQALAGVGFTNHPQRCSAAASIFPIGPVTAAVGSTNPSTDAATVNTAVITKIDLVANFICILKECID